MTRIYAEYFGGSFDIRSIYGHGCDAVLTLPSIDGLVGQKDVIIE